MEGSIVLVGLEFWREHGQGEMECKSEVICTGQVGMPVGAVGWCAPASHTAEPVTGRTWRPWIHLKNL